MENEEPLKKKRRKKKKRKKDMGNLFFNITQLAILCIFLGVCFIIFQTGYIQKIFQLHQEAQQIMETSTAADFQTAQQGEVYDKDGNLIALLKNDRNLIYLTSDEIPDTVKEAFVSIEDKRFYKPQDSIRWQSSVRRNPSSPVRALPRAEVPSPSSWPGIFT